jgi:hypothetical protein
MARLNVVPERVSGMTRVLYCAKDTFADNAAAATKNNFFKAITVRIL